MCTLGFVAHFLWWVWLCQQLNHPKWLTYLFSAIAEGPSSPVKNGDHHGSCREEDIYETTALYLRLHFYAGFFFTENIQIFVICFYQQQKQNIFATAYFRAYFQTNSAWGARVQNRKDRKKPGKLVNENKRQYQNRQQPIFYLILMLCIKEIADMTEIDDTYQYTERGKRTI